MKEGANPLQSILDYNSEVNNGQVNRAKEFFENMGNGSIGVGIIEMSKIIEVETIGSDYIQSDEETTEQGKNDFIEWIMNEYNKGEKNEK